MAALNELLATRVSALAAHDAAAWTATIADPAGTAGVAEFAAYQGLVDVWVSLCGRLRQLDRFGAVGLHHPGI